MDKDNRLLRICSLLLTDPKNTKSLSDTDIADKLNRVRIQRALSLLSPSHRHLVRLIPLFFQFHHRFLPGFCKPSVPYGIWGYQETEEIQQACKALSIFPMAEEKNSRIAFEGIYAMGSTASFGQSSKSDIDIWLIYHPKLSQLDTENIQQKADLLTQWFAQYQLEVNFYLVHPKQFSIENKDDNPLICCTHKQTLGLEHSGSSQHWLLLEEFYRTQIKLCGKTIAWWPEPKITKSMLYLGDVHKLSASEYLGASLWQLYKGLTKPHKSLLKVMLLEVYAHHYPNTKIITDHIWKQAIKGDFSENNDPYYLIYQYIETHLLTLNDWKRLEIVRRCFYLKSGIKLTDPNFEQDWRYEAFKQLAQKWHWQPELLHLLDNCEYWHSGQLEKFNQQLSQLMIQSYQTLLNFAANQQLNNRIRSDELNILNRKLHTYFNHEPHQVLKLNCLWSESIAEESLIISQKEQFHVFRPAYHRHSNPEQLYKNENLAAILCWACINGVATTKTKWFLQEKNKINKQKKITDLCKRLLQHLNLQLIQVYKDDLFNPWHFKQIYLILNLHKDPTQKWRGQEVMVDWMNANVFSLGRSQINMLASIDVISLNSWGEYYCHSFEGEHCALNALTFLSSGLRRTQTDIALEVISSSSKLKSQLEQVMRYLLKQAIRLCHHHEINTMLLQPVQISGIHYGIFYTNQTVHWQNLSDVKSLYQQLFKGHLVELPNAQHNHPLDKLPNNIHIYATQGVIQYFFCQQHKDVDVLVLDEENQLQHFIQQDSDIASIVEHMSHQYIFKQHETVTSGFNIPQFYHVNTVDGKVNVAPFGVAPEQLASEF